MLSEIPKGLSLADPTVTAFISFYLMFIQFFTLTHLSVKLPIQFIIKESDARKNNTPIIVTQHC